MIPASRIPSVTTPVALAVLIATLGLTACHGGEDNAVAPTIPTGLGYAASAASNTNVLAYVDTGDTNQRGVACDATVDTNAGVRVVREYLKIWQPRSLFVDAGVSAAANGSCPAVTASDWSGIPGSATDGTVLNQTIHDQNIAYVVKLTSSRTSAQELAAYLDDRRNKGYSVSDGMGPLTEAWRSGTGQTTTITSIAADATTTLYSDGGNNLGIGSASNNNLGLAVDFIGDMSNNGSTEPAKRYYKYARPWRWSSSVIVVPALVPAKSSTPATDSGFISGHTAEAMRDALAMGYLVPERFQEMIARAMELGENRIYAGMHSPLDVMGGRMQATAIVAYNLNNSQYSALKTPAYQQAQNWLQAQTSTTDLTSLNSYAHNGSNDRFADHSQIKADYLRRLSFVFSQINDTTVDAVVPKGAEVLLETRLPYLSAEQRRVVLKSTALPSGYPLLDDAEGWGRLNLFAAADGYGRFDGDVALDMDAAQGGFNAADSWQNDIAGAGKLTKSGSGMLTLTGNNSWTGGTVLLDGTLKASSATALGKGDVYQQAGTLMVASDLSLGGNYTQLAKSTLQLQLGDQGSGHLVISGQAWLEGDLNLVLADNYQPVVGDTLQLIRSNSLHGQFSSVTLSGYNVTPTYSNSGVQLHIDSLSH